MNEVYWDREQFVRYLSEHLDSASEITKVLDYIEGCFIMSTSTDAKVYLIEVPDTYSKDEIVEMTEYLLEYADVPIVAIPANWGEYRATLTAEKMGIKAKVKMLREKLRKVLNNG